jgi:hypothetical protein
MVDAIAGQQDRPIPPEPLLCSAPGQRVIPEGGRQGAPEPPVFAEPQPPTVQQLPTTVAAPRQQIVQPAPPAAPAAPAPPQQTVRPPGTLPR